MDTTVRFGNFYYIFYIVLCAAAIVGGYFALHRRTQKTQRIALLSIAFFNFALHFLKLAFPPYVDDLPGCLHKITAENICALSTLIFPFIYLIKKHTVLHDYAFFIGVLSGFAACVYPTEALGEPAFAFDSIRFYVCHVSLIAVPLLAALIGLHRPRLKKFWVIPLLFLAHETVIMLNEILLLKTGLIEGNLQSFLDRGTRNNSFVHGPTPDLDGIGKVLTVFTPKLFTMDLLGINGGADFYWPVVWLIGPVTVYFIPLYFLVASFVSVEFKGLLLRRKMAKKGEHHVKEE